MPPHSPRAWRFTRNTRVCVESTEINRGNGDGTQMPFGRAQAYVLRTSLLGLEESELLRLGELGGDLLRPMQVAGGRLV